MNQRVSYGLLCILTTGYLQTASLSSQEVRRDGYTVAIVEYSPDWAVGNEPEIIIKNSVANYMSYIEEAAAKKVDLIVFPEGGISSIYLPDDRPSILAYTTQVPDTTDSANGCDRMPQVASWLNDLSCGAQYHRIYVVLNLCEVQPCTAQDRHCPPDNLFIFNTNVVFDRQGNIVARYRKFHLFVEPGFDVTPSAEMTTFHTDIGVTFGMFICFDILFESPAVNLVREQKITNFIFSTAWFSVLPFLTAVQVQVGWAHANNVTLITAGYNNPTNTNGGSGVYMGQTGASVQYMPHVKSNRMLIATVSDKLDTSTLNGGAATTEYIADTTKSEMSVLTNNMALFKTEVLRVGSSEIELCQNELCCTFTSDMKQTVQEGARAGATYRAVVFDGLENFANVIEAGVQACALVFCLDDETDGSCALPDTQLQSSQFTFESLSVRGTFRAHGQTLQMPSTGEHSKIQLKFPTNSLLTFGIYLRDFSVDSLIHADNKSALVEEMVNSFKHGYKEGKRKRDEL